MPWRWCLLILALSGAASAQGMHSVVRLHWGTCMGSFVLASYLKISSDYSDYFEYLHARRLLPSIRMPSGGILTCDVTTSEEATSPAVRTRMLLSKK